MTDSHLRILRLMAQKRQRDVNDHDRANHTGQTAAAGHRQLLKRFATRTRARVAEAEARRLRR